MVARLQRPPNWANEKKERGCQREDAALKSPNSKGFGGSGAWPKKALDFSAKLFYHLCKGRILETGSMT